MATPEELQTAQEATVVQPAAEDDGSMCAVGACCGPNPMNDGISGIAVHGYDNLDDITPWCGVGCLSCFLDFKWPSCFGYRSAGDILCCTFEHDVCRILCEDSHPELKVYSQDWCMCHSGYCNCGDLKTLCALGVSCCCLDCRLGCPTDSTKTTPWLINLLGFTMMYQWEYPCSCCSTVGDLKNMKTKKNDDAEQEVSHEVTGGGESS
mmetsp:Transcript_88609/g.177158  ORF Transcript_88609/g.177158 Transcript_88609/m.177158 type:complete len:208 (-) Transcript_88609:159-782(-)|eukprot:CAMPEP_0171632128 /NCGR_PEP_ID=MMETSP0990-20121206/24174_1 /TAXON_ID=483369 /ORGANISM="non described non described, Strain CCMP2098" /LENGTH=207 /DNA_ID=CAMNT_0012202097 /DNA_START=703 /DNA_END=1326 /DNA_ORIENTATION=-